MPYSCSKYNPKNWIFDGNPLTEDQLVSRRYEHRSLLITTNLPFKNWDTVFPNASCAVALIDRLTHHVEILRIEGRSYRRREAELSQQERNRQRPARDQNTE